MVTLRSRRLETVFGVPLEQVQAEHIAALVSGGVQEDFDLDFKEQMYGTSEGEKRDLASDVAAMANSAGGVIVLGVSEDDHARASGAPGVALSEEIDRRILQVTAGVSPTPQVGVRRIRARTKDLDSGYVLIVVPRSLAGPHAVVVNATSLRFPVRHGTTTRYMSPPEVAGAFRQRMLSEAEQPERAERAENDTEELLGEDVWLQVSLTPALPGSLRVDSAALRTVQEQLSGKPMTLFSQFARSVNTRAGYRRIRASSDMHSGLPLRTDLIELHADGTGTWTHALWDMTRRAGAGDAADEVAQYLISDEGLVEAALSGATVLTSHARNRALASGQILLRVRLLNTSGRPVALGHTRSHGLAQPWGGTFALDQVPVGSAFADLDDVTERTSDLVVAVAAAVTDVVQSFGVPELAQLTADGQVRLPYWSHDVRPRLHAWADQSGIDLVEASL